MVPLPAKEKRSGKTRCNFSLLSNEFCRLIRKASRSNAGEYGVKILSVATDNDTDFAGQLKHNAITT